MFSFLSNNTLSRAELSDKGTIKNIHYGDVLIKFGDVIDANSTSIPFVGSETALKKKTDYLQTGDVIIADTAEDDTVGKATEILNENHIPVVSGLHTIPCRPNLSFVSSYLGYYFNSKSFHEQLYPFMQGIKVTSISKANLGKTLISYPEPTEQRKISGLLNLITARIEKQRQLVDLLKSYKRGVSMALFTQKLRLNKSCLPHNTEWSKKFLGDIFSERTERAVGNERLLAVTINYGVQDRTELDLKDNSSDDKRNYRVVHIGDLAYNTMRMWQGACGVSVFDGIVSPAYTVLYVTDNTENYAPFWGYYFKETSMLQTFQRNSQGLTSDTWNLKYEKFAHISVYAPSFQEQVQIAEFLDHISDKIATNEDFLNTLVKYKRGLLSLLFI